MTKGGIEGLKDAVRRRLSLTNLFRRELFKTRADARLTYLVAAEASRYIFTMSLDEYATSQGHSPSDYHWSPVTSRSYGSGPEDLHKAKALALLYEQMPNQGWEVIVELHYEASEAQTEDPPRFDIIAKGTGIKLKS